MAPRRVLCLAIVGTALLACSGGGGTDRGLDALTAPTFAPDPTGAPTTAGAAAATTTSTTTGGATGDPDQPAGSGAPTTEPTTTTVLRQSVTVQDPADDAVGGVGTDPPPWSDLAGAVLRRTGDAFSLSIRLGGGAAPQSASGNATMNIASFYDIDGDGAVDYEIWVNLGADGWGPTWFDDANHHAAAGPDSSVTVQVQGDSVVLLFPDVLLASAPTFRFSLASEYGEVSTIGSAFARRDDVPDGDRAVAFPG